MVGLVSRFAACCRAAGFRVSTAEVLDCTFLLQFTDPLDEEGFKRTLRCSFAKSRRDQAMFEQLYQCFFHDMKPELHDGEGEDNNSLAGEVIDRLRETSGGDALELALLDYLSGDPVPFVDEVHRIHTREEEASRAVKTNMGQLVSRMQVMLTVNRLRSKVLQFSGGNHSIVDPGDRKKIEHLFGERLKKAMKLLQEEPRPDNYSLKKVSNTQEHYSGLGDIPFSSLSEEEIIEVRVVIDRLVKKLEDIVTLRYSVKNRGKLDVRKTLRKSGKYLGVPMEPVFRDRPLRKGKLVVLCDVSGSVWSSARFMLNILYSLQECFSKVKSYVFVTEITEVTDFFVKHDVNRAVEKIMTSAGINYNDLTDYGMAFQGFKGHHMHELDRKTTLIMIGDARSNHMNPREHLLQEMRERCRRVIWLNPEQEKFWNTGDSEMLTYKNYCHEVRPCGNLNQLTEFIEDLVV